MGTYSENLPIEFVKTIIQNKGHKCFKSPLNTFWMRQENPGYISYGVHSKEGQLKLNNKGKKFFSHYKGWME